jgi:hypothetical protein
MTATDAPTYGFDELYPALGRLVVASAGMESRLRFVVSELAGSDAGWIIFRRMAGAERYSCAGAVGAQ